MKREVVIQRNEQGTVDVTVFENKRAVQLHLNQTSVHVHKYTDDSARVWHFEGGKRDSFEVAAEDKLVILDSFQLEYTKSEKWKSADEPTAQDFFHWQWNAHNFIAVTVFRAVTL